MNTLPTKSVASSRFCIEAIFHATKDTGEQGVRQVEVTQHQQLTYLALH